MIEALPVSARLMARFDREKLYQDIWKAPLVRVESLDADWEGTTEVLNSTDAYRELLGPWR